MSDRRTFLTCAIGGGVCVAVGVPLIRLILDPVGKQTVTTPREPLDLGPAERFAVSPTKVDIIAPVIKDAWAAARDVVLGAAYIRRVPATDAQKQTKRELVGPNEALDARSAVCPHLGCAVSYDRAQNNYLCPCHDSRFGLDGVMVSGPSKRGLDQLPLEIRDGRVFLTWERYKLGQATKERV